MFVLQREGRKRIKAIPHRIEKVVDHNFLGGDMENLQLIDIPSLSELLEPPAGDNNFTIRQFKQFRDLTPVP